MIKSKNEIHSNMYIILGFPNFRILLYVFQSAAVGSEVIKIEADDPDTGLGGLITFNMTVRVLIPSAMYISRAPDKRGY